MTLDSHSIAPNKEHDTADIVVTHVSFNADKMLVLMEPQSLPFSDHSFALDGQYQILLTIVKVHCFQILIFATYRYFDHLDLSVLGYDKRFLAWEPVTELQRCCAIIE